MRGITRSLPRRVAMLAGLVFLSGCGDDPEDQAKQSAPVIRPVKVFVVSGVSAAFQRSYPAVAIASSEVQLSFRVSGRIVELPVRAASIVKKGDVLAQLDKRDFESQLRALQSQIDEAKAKLRVMVAGARPEQVKALQADVAASQAKVVAAREAYKRTEALHKRGIVPNSKRDADRRDLQIAEAELRARQQKLVEGRAGARKDEVAQQKAKISGLEAQAAKAKDALSDTTLRAPFSGIIAKREVENFSNVKADQAVFTLQKLESLDLIFDVPGPDIAVFARRKDLKSTAELDSLPGKTFPVTLAEATTQADPKTQTYRIRVRIANLNGASVLPGMTGRVTVSADLTGKNEFRVPTSAVTADPTGKAFVWVIDQKTKKVTKRFVKTGGAAGSSIIVVDGLKSGEVVVSGGVSQLQENMTVRPMKPVGK